MSQPERILVPADEVYVAIHRIIAAASGGPVDDDGAFPLPAAAIREAFRLGKAEAKARRDAGEPYVATRGSKLPGAAPRTMPRP